MADPLSKEFYLFLRMGAFHFARRGIGNKYAVQKLCTTSLLAKIFVYLSLNVLSI